MHIAIILYEGMTALDAVGPYEVLSRLPGAVVEFVHAPNPGYHRPADHRPPDHRPADHDAETGARPAPGSGRFAGAGGGELPVVWAETGFLGFKATADLDTAGRPDLVLVPGGPVPPTEGPLLEWLRAVDEHTVRTTSVCTGSITLAAAGLLTGRRATTHWMAMDGLAKFGAVPTAGRVIVDGKYATSAGVSAGIDLALTIAAELAGPAVAQLIQLGIEYDPAPPFNAGSPDTAPAELVAHIRANPELVFGPL